MAVWMSRYWRRRLVAVVVVTVLVVGGAGAGAWWWLRVHDPLASKLEGLASDDPVAALDYLAPMDGGGQDGGSWVPSSSAVSRWGELLSRRWGERGLEAMAGVLAAASSLRASGDPVVAGRASWATGQGLGLFARVPVGRWDGLSGSARQDVGVVVAACGPEVARVAQGLDPGGGLGLDAADTTGTSTDSAAASGGAGRSVVASVVYRVVGDQQGADTVVEALMEATQETTAQAAAKGGGGLSAARLKACYRAAGRVMGFLDGLAQRRAGDAGGASERSTVSEGDIQTVLRARSYLEAARYGLLQDSTMAIAASNPDNDGKPRFFYSEDEDGRPVITVPDPLTPQDAGTVITWGEKAKDEPMTGELDGAVAQGLRTGSDEAGSAEVRG